MIYKDAFCQTSPFSFPTSYHCILISLPSLSLILLHTFLELMQSLELWDLSCFSIQPSSCPFRQFFCSQYSSLHIRCLQLQTQHGQSNCRFQQAACALWGRKLSILVPETYQLSTHARSLAICVWRTGRTFRTGNLVLEQVLA